VKFVESRDLGTFRERLLEWFRAYRRDLPWRRDRDPYRVWISEIMLQQTRVAAVIPYYETFLDRFPDVRALAVAPQEEVLRLWSGLGYYSRARNLQKAAQQVMAEYGGTFPRGREELLKLAGVGEYTAAAIASIAFEEKHAVLDGNVARVLARIGAIRGDLRAPKGWRALQARADELLEPSAAGEWNQAMMELGATVCTPKSPRCLLCPIEPFCEGRKLGLAESLPEKRSKRGPVAIELASAVMRDNLGRTLLLPPPETGTGKKGPDDHVPSLVANLWHFPTAAVNTSPRKTLENLLDRELKIAATRVKKIEELDKIRHTVTYRMISTYGYLVTVDKLPAVRGAQKVSLDEVPDLAISSLTRKVARSALRYLDK
jgi:A/G-specific adenine glycosylase